jgi:hypothetical protein
MAKWKNTEQKNTQSARFIYFKEGAKKTLTVTDWDFSKGKPYLFRCYVEEEDGAPVDKIWTVWDYESAKSLKKLLGIKYSTPKKLDIVMHTEDDESYFDVRLAKV